MNSKIKKTGNQTSPPCSVVQSSGSMAARNLERPNLVRESTLLEPGPDFSKMILRSLLSSDCFKKTWNGVSTTF